MGKGKDLQEFVKKVTEAFEPEIVLLFGSRARGDFLKKSDYDLIVVSKKFKGMHFLERIAKVYKFWNAKEHADVLCYTPEEFEDFSKRKPFNKGSEGRKNPLPQNISS